MRVERLRGRAASAARAWGVRGERHRGGRGLLSSRVAFFLLAAAATGLGCGWDGVERSVRFSMREVDEFARLPRLWFRHDGLREREDGAPARDASGGDGEWEEDERRIAETKAAWEGAGQAEKRGELDEARRKLREYLGGTTAARGGDWVKPEPHNCQWCRNSAADRLDALAAFDEGEPAAAVGAYLAARRLYDERLRDARAGAAPLWLNAEQKALREAEAEERARRLEGWAASVNASLDLVPRGRRLDDNVEYLRAAVLYQDGNHGEALKAFQSLAAARPRSEKREAALFMSGLITMKESKCYEGGRGASAEAAEGAGAEGGRGACAPDEAWHAARAAFARVMREYPRGRLRNDARGWLAFLALRAGDCAGALVEYYRLLGQGEDAGARLDAYTSLHLVRYRAADEDMARVEAELEDEPAAALAYAYHNIYNYARGAGAGQLEGTDSEWAEEHYPGRLSDAARAYSYKMAADRREALEKAAARREFARVVAFAGRLARRYPRALGGAFALRVAQAELELGATRDALSLAARSLGSGLSGEERAQALWVRGVAEHRLGDYGAARVSLGTLIAEGPRGRHAEGARRLLAMVLEDAGELGGALGQYLELDYAQDVAYFVDVLMTPEQLREFVVSRPAAQKMDELWYALGVRYMRAGRWDEARAAYARVRTSGDRYYSEGCWHCGTNDAGRFNPKDPALADGADPGVRARWVLRDLKTIEALERFERRAREAQGDEAKAEALYQLASYMFEGGTVLFYNPAAWRGWRAELLAHVDDAGTYRAVGEAERLWRYMQEHESPARALAVYLQVAQDYPQTRAARDALYTAAVCHERLADYNNYWRGAYGSGLHAGWRVVTYGDVRAAYPRYSLPLGTLDWEPSTRTVAGGPARAAAPPKPAPPTGAERARRRIKRAELRVSQGWELFGEVYGGRVRRWTLGALRWLLVALAGLFMLLVFRLTRSARRFLYAQLARCCARGSSRRRAEVYAPTSSYAAHLPYTTVERVRAAAGDVARGLWRLARDERGRVALALNVFAHGALTLLAWAFMWALRGG